MAQISDSRKGRALIVPTLRLEASLSLAAFLMSLTIALLNVYYSLRGSELSVDPPAQLILYRDGSGDASVLTAAIRFYMFNTSDAYGDVVKEAALSFDFGRTSFQHQGTLRTVLSSDFDGRRPACEIGMRCIGLPGLYIIERSDEILETPAGSARAFTLSFPIVAWNCESAGKDCSRFGSFAVSERALPAKELVATVALKFQSDGERTLRCDAGAIDRAYLQKVGWISVPCTGA